MKLSKPWWEEAGTDWTADEPQQALALLTKIYDERSKIKPVIVSAGLDWGDAPGGIATAREIWRWALDAAGNAGTTLDLVAAVLHDRSKRAYHPRLLRLLGDRLAPATFRLLARYGAPLEDDEVSEAMLDSLRRRGHVPQDGPSEGFEALTARPEGWVDSWANLQARVDQMRRTALLKRDGHPIGTGVLVGHDLLLTAAHVLDPTSFSTVDSGDLHAVFDFNTSLGMSPDETGNKVKIVDYICSSPPTASELAGKALND